ncbi:MAG: efflux RND transporter periplasmic adaptor subunit [Myxococcales bacterium]|nr:efflux RND transporter periplasmic adaptor subunit [Myxococcales bacterium]
MSGPGRRVRARARGGRGRVRDEACGRPRSRRAERGGRRQPRAHARARRAARADALARVPRRAAADPGSARDDRLARVGPRGRGARQPRRRGDGRADRGRARERRGRARARGARGARARACVRGSAARRAGQLHSERISPKRTVEEARGEQSVANAELQAARTRLRAYGVEPDHVDDGHGPSRVAIASPLAGTVVKRAAHVGQWAEPTHNLVEVASLDALWLEAAVYERELRFVHPGQEVTVEVRAFPGEVFKGTVALVDAMLDPRTRSAGVRVELPNPGHRLKPGMFATARVEGTHAHAPRRLLAIPWSAIQEVDGHQAVFARVGERAYELRRVHTGERAGDDVEILDGLAPGDEVAALGSFLLKGQLLRETLGEDE